MPGTGSRRVTYLSGTAPAAISHDDARSDAPLTLATEEPTRHRTRLRSIDLLRGLVIVLMVLDHVRDFFHSSGYAFDPLDLARTTPLLYATRWITHVCAPTFVFLAGVSAWLQLAKGKEVSALSAFLLKRGLWLVAIELTIVSFAVSFSIPYMLFLQVIWAIGWSMVALAALVRLPRAFVLLIGIAIVAGHNLLDPLTPAQFGAFGWLWTALAEGGVWTTDGTPVALILYPILPWVGVMCLGYGLAPVFLSARRDRILAAIGLGMIAAFVGLRLLNGYGNPEPWVADVSVAATIMRFMDVAKYPPSLMYVCATLGPMLLLVPLLERARGAFPEVLKVFGAVPLFAYLLHLYIAHALAIAAHGALGRPVAGLFDYLRSVVADPASLAPAIGLPLPLVFIGWIVTLAILYPCCRWWGAVKARRRDWWLSYL